MYGLCPLAGIGIGEIAARSGRSQKFVRQRLVLGGVHPKLLDLARKGKVANACLMDFTVCAEQQRQWACYFVGPVSQRNAEPIDWTDLMCIFQTAWSTLPIERY
jgi:hypothetical protein